MSKPSARDLLNSLNEGISSGWDKKHLSSTRVYSLYELYVFKCVIEAVLLEGDNFKYPVKIAFKDHSGKEVNPIRLQTGPHSIDSYGYVYAEIWFPGFRKRPIEVHCGVKYTGKSGVEHECDVSIVGRTEASRCRTERLTPRHQKLLLSIECKFYASTIELAMMRGFRGLIDDLGASQHRQIFLTSALITKPGKILIKYTRQNALEQFIPGKWDVFHELRFEILKMMFNIIRL